eukprot:TRINITY_DN3622_c0_g3_i1.p1 TRINITY_DN3622_c0_g3~~TRINITY_DN3622_c0_g3_i1.p1  ORF type:complete len:498 (+),score=166.24 TRINITY_DN3622_c0_g3_i1:128-1495(+)
MGESKDSVLGFTNGSIPSACREWYNDPSSGFNSADLRLIEENEGLHAQVKALLATPSSVSYQNDNEYSDALAMDSSPDRFRQILQNAVKEAQSLAFLRNLEQRKEIERLELEIAMLWREKVHATECLKKMDSWVESNTPPLGLPKLPSLKEAMNARLGRNSSIDLSSAPENLSKSSIGNDESKYDHGGVNSGDNNVNDLSVSMPNSMVGNTMPFVSTTSPVELQLIAHQSTDGGGDEVNVESETSTKQLSGTSQQQLPMSISTDVFTLNNDLPHICINVSRKLKNEMRDEWRFVDALESVIESKIPTSSPSAEKSSKSKHQNSVPLPNRRQQLLKKLENIVQTQNDNDLFIQSSSPISGSSSPSGSQIDSFENLDEDDIFGSNVTEMPPLRTALSPKLNMSNSNFRTNANNMKSLSRTYSELSCSRVLRANRNLIVLKTWMKMTYLEVMLLKCLL